MGSCVSCPRTCSFLDRRGKRSRHRRRKSGAVTFDDGTGSLLVDTKAGFCKLWRYASASLIYSLVQQVENHTVVIFDSRERDLYHKCHIHYAACPWRSSQDVEVALSLYHSLPAHSELWCEASIAAAQAAAEGDLAAASGKKSPNTDYRSPSQARRSQDRSRTTAGRSIAGNRAARSPRFIAPTFEHTTNPSTNRAKELSVESPLPSPSPLKASELTSNSTATTQAVLPSATTGHTEGLECSLSSESAAVALSPIENADSQTLTTDLRQQLSSTHPLSDQTNRGGDIEQTRGRSGDHWDEKTGSSSPSKDDDVREKAAKAALRRQEENAQQSVPREEPAATKTVKELLFQSTEANALKKWLCVVCKFRTVVVYGETEEGDPLLMQFVNYLMHSDARFKEVFVLAGGMEKLRSRYGMLLNDSDYHLPGPIEILPPTSANTKFGLFISNAKLLKENAEILEAFNIKCVINLTSEPCPLEPSRGYRVYSVKCYSELEAPFDKEPPSNPLYDQYTQASYLIHLHGQKKKQGVLIYDLTGDKHCAAVCAWYLIELGYGVVQTINFIKRKKSSAQFNSNIMSSLHELGEDIKKGGSGRNLSSGSGTAAQSPISPATSDSSTSFTYASARKALPKNTAQSMAAHVLRDMGRPQAEDPSGTVNPEEEEEEVEAKDKLGKLPSSDTEGEGHSTHGEALLNRRASKNTRGVSTRFSFYESGSIALDETNKSRLKASSSDVDGGTQTYKTKICETLRSHEEAVSEEEFQQTVKLLCTIFNNVLNHPTDPKYRVIKTTNQRFDKSIGQYQQITHILIIAGFILDTEGGVFVLPSSALLQRMRDVSEVLSTL